MTLDDAVTAALAAYDADDGEREAILHELVPVLLGDRAQIRAAIERAWATDREGVIEAITAYRDELAALDVRIAEVAAFEGRVAARDRAGEVARRIVAAGAGDALELARLVVASTSP